MLIIKGGNVCGNSAMFIKHVNTVCRNSFFIIKRTAFLVALWSFA